MPARVRLRAAAVLRITLTRGEVVGGDHEVADRQVIAVDPAQPLTITVLRRGFDLAPGETGRRELALPPLGEPAVTVEIALVAAELGPQEIQVVVRQDRPQPLATLRLTPEVVPPDTDLPPDGEPLERTTTVPRGVTAMLAPNTLVIDENLVGANSELSFELVTATSRAGFTRVVPDKPELLRDLFTEIADAYDTHRTEPDPQARTAGFQQALRDIGTRLAGQVLPAELADELRSRPLDADQLTVITSGETDIPWELVHVWDDLEDDLGGFLGRAGLVRWVYNTPHPSELAVHPDRAFVVVARRADRSFELPGTGPEYDYLVERGVREVDPLDAASLGRLIGSGRLDLLHFCGHGRYADDPAPLREMVLGTGPGFSLTDLASALSASDAQPFGTPGPLVVLNACRLGQPPQTRSELGGFAETFLRGGAGAFLGCLWSVGDAPAADFVMTFYDRLHAGDTVAEATLAARRSARRAGDLSWLAYTVYAHPDARLTAGLSPRGTTMTTTETPATQFDVSRGPGLTADQLRFLHPHTVNLTDGRLSTDPPSAPTTVADFHTTAADVDAIFDTHLPTFLAGRPADAGPLPLVLWAHGGLVPKPNGLAIAHQQVGWWRDNGAYPVHFIWDTGLIDGIVDAIRTELTGRRGLTDITDNLIERLARTIQARRIWGAMKDKAAWSNQPVTGGAHYFVTRLARYVGEHPGTISVHAVGHSAGSIFHSHLVPNLVDRSIDLATLQLLAPAIRVDEFRQRLLPAPILDQVGKLTMYTMNQETELADNCGQLYHKSLLYLIRGGLEAEVGAEILGLQECVRRDPQLNRLFGSGGGAEVCWSVGKATASRSHGGFDNDETTMNSVATRVLGHTPARPFPAARDADARLWAGAILPTLPTTPATDPVRRRALCIGIDAYPPQYALAGCVNDSKAWAQALAGIGFEVTTLQDDKATRAAIVAAIGDLVSGARPGDHVVVQYAGHGTTAPDLDGDEAEEDKDSPDGLQDEAICPVDFSDGQLLLDDDLGALWDLLPAGAQLTVFFDSCHSGGAQRELITVPPSGDGSRPRLVRLTRDIEARFRQVRAATAKPNPSSRANERGAFFAACQPDEVAWESSGHGDFTTRMVPLLATATAQDTNWDLINRVLAEFGPTRRQTPLLSPSYLGAQLFLDQASSAAAPPAPMPATKSGPEAGAAPTAQPAGEAPALAAADTGRDPARRDRAIATILRGVADLVES